MSIDSQPVRSRSAAAPATGAPARPATVVVAGVAAAGVGAVLLARLLTGTGYLPSPFGLPDAGWFTATALPLAGFGQEMAGSAAVGALVIRLLLGTGGRTAPRLDSGRAPAVSRLGAAAVAAAWVWVGFTVMVWVLSLSDLAGVPVGGLPAHTDTLVLLFGTDRMLAVTATLWMASVVVMFGRRLHGPVGGAVLVAVAVIGLMPQALTGHVAHHNTDVPLSTAALAVHVAAAAIWVGGLYTVIVHLRREPSALAVVVPKFSALALGCVLAVGVSGVVATVAMIDDWSELWSSPRGALTLAKAVALGMLVAIGAWHRRRTVAAAASGRIGPLLRLGAVELAVMAGAVGLAVVLAGTA